MISQNSNNKPNGSTAVQCDAGIPIMGRTADTGTYEILKLNADGSLPAPTPTFPQTNGYLYLPQNFPLPAAAYAAGVILYYNQLITGGFRVTITDAGVYTIRPFYMVNAVVSGSVSFMLVTANSFLDLGYLTGRAIGSDTFAPSITDVQDGVAAFWHNIAMETFGAVPVEKTIFNTNQPSDFYLPAGDYKLLVICHTAITTGAATTYFGFETFYKK